MQFSIIKKFLSVFLILFSFQAHALTTKENQIVDEKGSPIELKGVNWFGFNNQSTMLDGLWNSSEGLSFDFITVAYRMKLLGFNAVRLPFSFKDLFELTPRNYTQTCCLANRTQIQASVTNPLFHTNRIIPPMFVTLSRKPGMANEHLPNDTTVNRFLWVINYFVQNGFYVLIDNHLREDTTAVNNPSQWTQSWVQLAQLIAQDPLIKDKVMIDILNEPDNYGIRWEASNNGPALKDLYISVMDALYLINPNFLFFIEGTGQGGIGANWGDGFVTDPNLIAQYGLSDPNPFFQTLMNKPYLNQIVLSPHVYPPSVTGATKDFSGSDLYNRLSHSFGSLSTKGYCTEATCKKFPIAIGEFGSRFIESRDLQFLADFSYYLNHSSLSHDAIPNWFYWSWNANSGDTGGIVMDNWRDIQWNKIDYLTEIGLKPWYLE